MCRADTEHELRFAHRVGAPAHAARDLAERGVERVDGVAQGSGLLRNGRRRELLVEPCFIVRPVKPDLSAVDVASLQQIVQVREARIGRQRQSGPDVPNTVGSGPCHVLTHDYDGTRQCPHVADFEFVLIGKTRQPLRAARPAAAAGLGGGSEGEQG